MAVFKTNYDNSISFLMDFFSQKSGTNSSGRRNYVFVDNIILIMYKLYLIRKQNLEEFGNFDGKPQLSYSLDAVCNSGLIFSSGGRIKSCKIKPKICPEHQLRLNNYVFPFYV